MLNTVANRIFGTSDEREVKKLMKKVEQINALEPKMEKLSDFELKGKTEEFKIRFENGEVLDEMLVEAFAAVHDKHPDYILKIYGPDGEDGTLQRIEDNIRKFHLESCVKLMGGSDSLEKEIPEAAVFAYSSDYEGMPNSLTEAMAMGLPVVSTDCQCGGPRMLIRDHINGLIVPVRDPGALAAGICYLIEHPQEAEQMGTEARKLADIANTKAIFEQWRSYLEDVIAHGRKC